MSINNRKSVVYRIFPCPFILLVITLFFLYFRSDWLFTISLILFVIVITIQLLLAKYLDIKMTNNRITLKEIYLLGGNKPIRFLDVPLSYIAGFSINKKHEKLNLITESKNRTRTFTFSMRHFRRNEKLMIKNALEIVIKK